MNSNEEIETHKNSEESGKILVIVESPAKTKSLSKFLGKNYRVESSKGHLIDLPKSSLGVDIEHGFEPKYITIRGKGKTLANLKKAAKMADSILLATDPDREGEAISWHLERELSPINSKIKRIEFHEITKEAILKAIENPRELDMKKINSQQARRILDRLVGYGISPILQEKFGSKRFSAGRVQSAALKILCDREEEIEKFKPQEYWEISAAFRKDASNERKVFFSLTNFLGNKPEIKNQEEALQVENLCNKTKFIVLSRKVTERKSKPLPPYTTSRLQQDASTKLGFRAQKTMSLAQELYEGVELENGVVTGLITYMRTDSTRISQAGIAMAREYISQNFAEEFLPEKPNIYEKAAKTAQDAHEAIRPTDVSRTPASIEKYLSRDLFRLYDLIWRRFVASQMTPAVDEIVSFEVGSEDGQIKFRYSASREKFAGYRAVFPVSSEKEFYIPPFEENDRVELWEIKKEQKFTQPPPRYTEASLIKAMEESGIGRPATYVPTITILEKRAYIERKGRQLIPTPLGRVVNQMMEKHFPDIVDLDFTANMEEQLDAIAEGQIDWRQMLLNFYNPFKLELKRAKEEMQSQTHLVREPIGRQCPDCGHPLLKKLGKSGFFIGCSNFAGGCRYTESIPLGSCPLCGGKVVKKKSKKGRPFYGCENYVTTGCQFIMLDVPASRPCPRCGSLMGQKIKKSGITLTCQNPECRYTMEEVGDEGGESTESA